jgi:hypothetical protein
MGPGHKAQEGDGVVFRLSTKLKVEPPYSALPIRISGTR